MEPLLDPARSRLTMFPIEYPTLWDNYQKQLACFWQEKEIDFSHDRADFERLDEQEQFFVKRVLAFFASADGLVNWNLSERFLQEVQAMEARTAYSFQMAMENIHSTAYSLMLDNLVKDTVERQFLFDSLQTIPSIRKMGDWAVKWIQSSASFAHRVIAFAVIEGVFFSGAFASIFWLKRYKGNILPGLVKSNEFIARDEGLHTLFAIEMYKLLKTRLPAETVEELIDDGVQIAKEFVEDALPVRLIGMNREAMSEYIEYVADRLLYSLGYSKKYGSDNPFSFMETIGMKQKTNFFESRPTEYQKAQVQAFEVMDDF